MTQLITPPARSQRSTADAKPARLSREDWIEAARLVLIASGVDDVKVDRLAKRLGVTRGSFYWHFKHRKELLEALLAGWATQNRAELARIRERKEHVEAGLLEAVRIWLGEDPAYPTFDMAIRFWARKSREVASLVRAIDEEWIILFAAIFESTGEDRMMALARARIIYFHQIGYYALALDESMEERLALAPYYHRVLTGTDGGSALTDAIADVRLQGDLRPKPND